MRVICIKRMSKPTTRKQRSQHSSQFNFPLRAARGAGGGGCEEDLLVEVSTR